MIPAFDHFFIGDVLDMHDHQLKVDISKTTPKPSQFSNKFFLKRKNPKTQGGMEKVVSKILTGVVFLTHVKQIFPTAILLGFFFGAGHGSSKMHVPENRNTAGTSQNLAASSPGLAGTLLQPRGTSLEPCRPCWNLAGTSPGLAGTLLEFCWNVAGVAGALAGASLEPCCNLAEPRWNLAGLAGTLLEHGGALLEFAGAWNLAGTMWLDPLADTLCEEPLHVWTPFLFLWYFLLCLVVPGCDIGSLA